MTLDELIRQANGLVREKRFDAAHQLLQRALDDYPDSAAGNLLMGIAAQRLGHFEEAADHLALAIHYGPNLTQAYLELGMILFAQGKLDEAATNFDEVVRIDPGLAKAHRQLGLIHFKSGRGVAAEAALRRAVELAPNDAYARSDLACVYFQELDQIQVARSHLERALADNPNCIDAQINLGMAEQCQGRWGAALSCFERALELDPCAEEARLNRGIVRLMSGDFGRGWPDYESRKRVGQSIPGKRLPYPEWNGEPLHDKGVIVYGEQGLGDEIMFASCLPDLFAVTGRVILYCSPKLEQLYRRSFPADLVIGGAQAGSALPLSALPWRPNFKLAIGSLGLRFRIQLEDFSRTQGYLKANPARVRVWRERLAAAGPALNVGISWRGGTAKTQRNERSIPLDQFVPILRLPGVRCVSVQYGECADELVRLRDRHGIELTQFEEALTDYDETAALVSALDLVISVCTAVIHLGGALGKPVWVLVPHVPAWRYMCAGDSMPWYPSVTMHRQDEPGHWQKLIEQLARRLEHTVPI